MKSICTAVALGLLVGGLGCGGTAPPQRDGSGGSGGSAAASFPFGSEESGVGAGEGSGGESTGLGGGPLEYPIEICDPFCERADAAGCALHPALTCVEFCEETIEQVGDCDAALAEEYRCEAGRIESEGCGVVCGDEKAAYLACVYPPDGTGDVTCNIVGEDKICTATSSSHTFTSECYLRESDWGCTCSVDGEVQGTCLGHISDDQECCLSFFSRAS